jgi:TonB-linked SusC/RagA family outer membrane protein
MVVLTNTNDQTMKSRPAYQHFSSIVLSVLACCSVYGQDSIPAADKKIIAEEPSVHKFLQQVQPIAFGPARPRQLLTGAYSQVHSQTLRSINAPNIANTLSGRLAGLYVSTAGSAPGNNDQPGLLIRGRQTFQDNTPLVIVDGFETNWSNLLIDEIETVSVLRDASALALYGMDAANGAILITTKRGKANPKTQISFQARVGFQSPTQNPKLLGNGDYAELFNIATVSDGRDPANGLFRSQEIVDYYKNGNYPYLYPNVNWQENVLKSNTMSQDYSLTFNGGNKDARYFVALGYGDYQGIYANTERKRNTNSNYNLKRYNVRANFDVNINQYISSEVNFRATMMNKYFPNAGENTIFRNLQLFLPYAVTTPSGNWGGTQGFADNPAALTQQTGYSSINDRTIDANVKLIGHLDKITPGLNIIGQMNFHNFYFDTYNKTRGFSYEELIPRPVVNPGDPIQYDSLIRGNTDKNFSITQGTGNQVNRTNVLAGFEWQRSMGKGQWYASALYFQEVFKGNGADMPFAKQGVMGRIHYQWNQKLLTEFNWSYFGSEAFPKGNRFGFFPSLGLGWVLSKEDFLANQSTVQFLKIRGSVGLLGNDKSGNTGRFIYNQTYNGTGTFILGNNLSINAPMFNQGNLANTEVTWEKALRSNLGVDATLFRNLSVSLDYFFEKRTDIFVNPANFIPDVMGVVSFNQNRGKVNSSGAELELMWTKQEGKFQYYLGGQASYARNKIVTIEEPARPFEYLQAKGNPINQPFVLEAIGFFRDNADIQNSPTQLFGNVRPGDIKYKDQNNDGFIDDNDRVPLGNPSYPELHYGVNGGFSLHGFDFNVFLQGAAMRTVSLLDNSIIVPFLNGGVKPSQWVKDHYWTPDRGDAALFPRLTTEANANNYRGSSLWQRNGGYLRVRNIELGYTLAKSVTQKVKINSCRFYFSANNILTLDGIDELDVDPEVMNIFVHPPLKSLNIGVTLTF